MHVAKQTLGALGRLPRRSAESSVPDRWVGVTQQLRQDTIRITLRTRQRECECRAHHARGCGDERASIDWGAGGSALQIAHNRPVWVGSPRRPAIGGRRSDAFAWTCARQDGECQSNSPLGCHHVHLAPDQGRKGDYTSARSTVKRDGLAVLGLRLHLAGRVLGGALSEHP